MKAVGTALRAFAQPANYELMGFDGQAASLPT
jgi:hypothetical protein